MAKIKVSQATIDKIKAMGMTKALKGASKANPEMKEALTRMYGARRVSAAMPSKPAAKSADAARSAATAGPRFKSADSARRSATPAKPVAKSADAARMGAKTVMSKPGTTVAKRRDVPGKPSVGEKISAAFTGKGVGNRPTATSVAATNAKRMGISVAEYNKRLAAKKNK